MNQTSKTTPNSGHKDSVVFFGSGPVANASLDFLAEHFEIEAVITKPKPPHHRGEMETISLCEKRGFNYFTPASKKELTDLFSKNSFKSDLGIVIDYGIIIEQSVIDYFQFGIINSHFSLLPELRGADPITFSILSGQQHSGVSLMSIVAAMDEGPILAQGKIEIKNDDTSETLTTKLIQLSNKMLIRGIPLYKSGDKKLTQQQGTPTYSRKLIKQDGTLDWSKPADVLEREIRAFHSWPKSRGKIGNMELIIRSARVVKQNNVPGTFTANKHQLIVHCGSDSLEILEVQPPGKKEMPIRAFLAGYNL